MKPFLPLVCALLTASFISPARAQVAKPAHPLLSGEIIPQTWGANIHFTDAAPGELEMLRAGGFSRVRMDLIWSETEKARGQYDFAAYDRLLASLDKRDVSAYFILDYGNPLYSRDAEHPFTDGAETAEYRAAYASWAAAAVAHFKGRGVVWEIWNEPNIPGFWKPKPDVQIYSGLALAACRAIRAIAPDECIIGPATSQIDLVFLQGCFEAGLLQFWDGVSVHPYRQGAPELAAAEYRNLRALIERYKPAGRTIPIVSGEWGYSAGWNAFDADRQGRYLPREWLLNAYQEIPVSIWYDWHDDGTDPKEPEHHFGAVENSYHADRDPVYDPKPAYVAAKTLTRNLDGFRFNKRLWTGREADWVLLFERGPQVRLACWTTDEKPHAIQLPASNGNFTRTDYLGQILPDMAAQGEQLTLELSENVSYFAPQNFNRMLDRAAMWPRVALEVGVVAPTFAKLGARGAPAPIWRDTPAFARVETLDGYAQISAFTVSNPLSATPFAPGNGRVAVQISNPTGALFKGQLMVWSGEKMTRQPFTMEVGERTKSVEIALAAPAATTLGVQIGDAEGAPLTARRDTRFVPLSDITLAATADGDAKVASTQTVSLGAAPAPLLGQNAPVVKLDYSWDAGWKFVTLAAPAQIAIEGAPRAVQMWIYGDGAGHRARLRLRDASGQTLQPNGVAINWKGWRAVTFPLDAPDMGHWGGADDGQIHGALTWGTPFLLDSAGASKGTIWLSAPTLVYGN